VEQLNFEPSTSRAGENREVYTMAQQGSIGMEQARFRC